MHSFIAHMLFSPGLFLASSPFIPVTGEVALHSDASLCHLAALELHATAAENPEYQRSDSLFGGVGVCFLCVCVFGS